MDHEDTIQGLRGRVEDLSCELSEVRRLVVALTEKLTDTADALADRGHVHRCGGCGEIHSDYKEGICAAHEAMERERADLRNAQSRAMRAIGF